MTSEEFLFEGILNDFKIDDGRGFQPARRSLNDYYFELMEKFDLESLLIGKVFNNSQVVIVFDAVTKAGQKMDIHYHNGKVKRITDFTPEMLKWRTAFLNADKLRGQPGKEVFSDTNQQDPALGGVDFRDDKEHKSIVKSEEDYELASKNLVQVYTE